MTEASTNPVLDLRREMEVALRIAQQAGDILTTFYEIPPVIGWKPGDEPVTEADRAANAYLVGELAQAFPEDGILAEESVDDLARLGRRRVWMVDPLDGTTEFIAHNDEFCVMIGLAVEGRPVLGVIYEPMAGVAYAGADGMGAFVEQLGECSPLKASATADLKQLRPLVSRSHRAPLVDTITRALGCQRERIVGSIGLKTANLARGQADFYIHPSHGPKEWDTCAPEAILRLAGGVMTDCWNRPLPYNQRAIGRPFGVLASNCACRAQLSEAVICVLDEADVDPEFGF